MGIAIATVLIDRDATVKLPATVPEYEAAVLEVIHGEECIIRVSEADMDADELTADVAFNTLLRKYAQHEDAVRSVFKNVRAFAAATGLPLIDGDASQAKEAQSSIIIHPVEKPAKKIAVK